MTAADFPNARAFLKANLARLPAPTELWVDRGRLCITYGPETLTFTKHLEKLPQSMKTPKTNQLQAVCLGRLCAAKADERLAAARNELNALAALSRELETENLQLRQGCANIAAALGNGSAASPEASVEFLTESLAKEVRLYCAHLRANQKP